MKAVAPRASDAAVQVELMSAFFGSVTVPLINVAVGAVSAVAMWQAYPAWVILTWAGALFAVVVFRLVLWSRFRRQKTDIAPWAFGFILGSVLTGALWGLLASAIFMSPDPVYVLFAAFVLGGLCAGAAIHNSPYLPAYYGFVIPAALPIIAALLTRDAAMTIGMGLLLLVFVAVLTLVAHANKRQLADYIGMKIEQTALSDELKKTAHELRMEVAERDRVAVELERSNERFRAIGEHALDAIIIANSAGEAVYWNAAAERSFGYSADEIVGRNIHQMLTPERNREKAFEHYARFARTGEGDALGKTVQLDALRKDGTEFPIELALSAMKLGGDRYALGVARDVSERVKAVQMLNERDAELREAQRVAHVGSWSYDPATGASSWSDELYRIFELDAGSPTPGAAEYAKLLKPGSAAAVTAALKACGEHGTSFEIDLEIQRPDGLTGWVSMRGEARRGTDGKLWLSGTTQDVTSRKHAEQIARDAEVMFRSLVEQNMSGTAIVAEDGGIVYLNPSAVRMLGFNDSGPAINRPVLDFIADSDKPVVAAAMQALFGSRRDSVEVAVRLRRSDDQIIDVLAQATIGTFRERRVIFTVIVDITERRRAEDRIARLNEQMAITVAVLRRRDHDQTEIAKLSDLLQSCTTVAEAYPIIAAAAKLVFPDTNGAMARVERGTRELTRTAAWGADKATLPQFLVDDCWALRTGQRREVAGPKGAVQCHHFSQTPEGPYICLPLVVQGETRGLLHVGLREGGSIDDDLRQAMQSFGDVVKLSLANINQRESLSRQALRDQLTGLFNRRYLLETLPREVRRAQRSRSAMTVAMLDIDFFKRFNDAHGHDAGDLVLSDLGRVLRESLRAGDIACRYGGEEFLLVLPDCDLASARARLTRICLQVKGRVLTFRGEKLPTVTVSIGMATLSEILPDGESLITAADKAMYLAKANGRDRIESFLTPEAAGPELAPTAAVPV